MIKLLDILGRYEAAEFGQLEAAELLGEGTKGPRPPEEVGVGTGGMGERTFRRWCQRYEEAGEAGLRDARLGKVSGKRVPTTRQVEIEALYRERYNGFTAKHFHEHLVKDHGFTRGYTWGYTWTKTFLHSKGLLEKAKTRGAHRRKRPRRPMPGGAGLRLRRAKLVGEASGGMMLHQDGSRHVWLAGMPAMDLIVTLDDATSTLYSAFLVDEEGTASTFRALNEVFGQHGLPLSLYTDRGSHYFHTPDAGGKVDRDRPTQVGRALAHLGVEHIAAYSPQARGRSERMFHTLQDRLTKELALAEITTVEVANAFLRDVSIPAHNTRFAIKAEQEGSAFITLKGVELAEILCVQEERQVGNDNCVSVNWLEIVIAKPNGTVTFKSSFVTDLPVNRESVAEIAACGRARWKIENETFNVLKNSGYNLEHNFGHGTDTLASLLVVFNLLAFAMHCACDLLVAAWEDARKSLSANNSSIRARCSSIRAIGTVIRASLSVTSGGGVTQTLTHIHQTDAT